MREIITERFNYRIDTLASIDVVMPVTPVERVGAKAPEKLVLEFSAGQGIVTILSNKAVALPVSARELVASLGSNNLIGHVPLYLFLPVTAGIHANTRELMPSKAAHGHSLVESGGKAASGHDQPRRTAAPWSALHLKPAIAADRAAASFARA
jgi:hypothetical protein